VVEYLPPNTFKMKFENPLTNIRIAILAGLFSGAACLAETAPLNILLFTADDLHRDSLGCYGSPVEAITPNLDRFAREGMLFDNAHVNTAICEPSRKILASGLYGFNSGSMGFMKVREDVPIIHDTLGEAGYLTGVIGKLRHSTPKVSYEWDYAFGRKDMGDGRNPTIYYERSLAFFEMCKEAGKPFYFMANSEDPHLPWYDPKIGPVRGAEAPSRLYSPDEFPVPDHLPDIPGVRKALANYYNSTKRMDDTFGKVMQALDESGMRENTLIVYLSDNGIATPFSKCNTFLASTRTPFLVQWPGVVKPGSINESLISSVDFAPTILEALGLSALPQADGRSLLSLFRDSTRDSGKSFVFTQVDSKVDGAAIPMRCVQNKKFGYMYNMWHRDDYYYRNNNEVDVMKAMEEAAENDPAIMARIMQYRYRSLEELYDLENDPGCLVNLAESPEYRSVLDSMRGQMESNMEASGDPLLRAFQNRGNSKIVQTEFDRVYPNHNSVINRKEWERY
jgi:N-sulfoglucosamine sulfohydrolase